MSINSIYSKLSTLVETKRLLRQAIIDKGVPLKKDRDTFRDYVNKINNIVQESPHGKNAPYIDDSLVFCEDYSEIQASKLNLASDSSILDMECPFTVELSFVLDSSVELTQSFETFIDFSFVRIGAQRVSEQQLYLMYGEHLSSDWSYTMWLTDNSNPTSDCILPKDQVVTITCVRYSDHALIYKNGELIITSEESFTELFDTAFSIYRPFDADAAGYHSVINTTINNVRIYNKALNENEIYYNYSIDLLNNGNTQYLNTNHIKSGLVYGINPILPLTGINSHDNVSNYNNHFDNLSIPISLQNGFTIEWRGSISDIMSNDNEPYDYTGRLFTFKKSDGTDTFEVCATMDSEDTDIFDISFKASNEYLIDSEDWLEVFSDILPSIKFSSDFTLSITVSSTAVNVYINGVLEASSSTYQNKFTNANLWKILYLFTNSLESPLQGTDGFLYSLRIYNRVLNEYEINYNYKVDTRSDIKNPDPLYGKAILGELGNMTLNASGVIIPKAFNCSKPFEIVSCFKMKSDESENDKNFALFGSSDASNYSAYPSIEIRPYTNKLWVGVSINPNSWTYTQEVNLSDIPIVYDNNVLNWIKMEYDGDKIYLSHSIDCLSWTRFHTITSIVPYNPVTNDYTLIFGAKLQNSNLTYTYKSNGETSFSFMNSWVKSCNKTIWGREIMGQELYTNNSTVLVPNGDVRYNAGSFIAYPNLDMSDDFEVVVCLAIDKTAMTSGQTYYLAGGINSSTSNFRIYATYYNIGYQIFYGTHTVAEDDVSWEDTVSNFIYNEGVQNFLKLKKRDGKVSFYHSLDAINWSLLNEVEINSETFTDLQDDGIRFGNAGSDTSTALPMTDTSFINLHNSYVKINGEVVWGREIREKAQVYAPVLKREVTLYKPDISQFTDGDNVIENLAVGNCSMPVYDVDKYQDYLNFNKKYNSKLIIPANPLSYDKTCLSFTIKFPSPNVGYWNSIVGVNAKKTIPNDTSNTFVNFLYISSASSSYIDNDKKGVRLIVANTKRVIRTNDTIVSSANTNNSSPYESYLILSQTLFPVSGWNIDIGFKLEFDNIHNTITLSIDNTEAAVVELNDNIEYLYQPVGITFGYFDDNKISSPSSLTMYIKDIEYTIEGSVSKNMIERIECTSEEYLSESSHNDQILYNVTYPDNSVKQFLGNKELGGTVESIRYHEAVLYKPDISGFVSGDTEIYNLGVGNSETQLVNVTKYNDYLCFPEHGESKFDFIANPMAYDKTQISFVTRFDEPSRTWNSIFGIDAEKTNPDRSRTIPNFLYMSLVSSTGELVERRGLRIYLYANGIVRSNSDIISNIRNESPYIWIFFNKTLFPVSGWTSDVKFDLKFDNINHTLSIFIDDIEAIVISLFEIYPYDRYPVKAVFGWFDDSNESTTDQSLYFKDIEYKIEGAVSRELVNSIIETDCTSEEYSQLGTHDPNTLYNVTYPDESTKRFLRNEELDGTITVVKTRKVTLYEPDIASFVSNSGTINNLGSSKQDIYISSEVIKNRGYLKFTNNLYGIMCILANPKNYDKTRLKFTIKFPTPRQETNAWNQIFGCMGDKINQSAASFAGTNLINYMYMALLNNNSGFTGLLFVIKESVTIIRYDSNMISTIDHSQDNRTNICFNTTIFPVTGWNLDKKIVLEFNNIDNIVSLFVDDTEAIVMSISNSTSYDISPVKYSLGSYNEGNTDSNNTGVTIELLIKDIIYEVEGACSADMFDEIDYTPSEYYSLESYDDHRVYNVNYQDGTIRRFLGDEEIGIIRPEPKYNVVSNFYGDHSPIFPDNNMVCYKILNTHTNFDTSDTFDIIIAFKLTSSTHSSAYCLFGTAYYNQSYNYPTCEITTDNSLWFALNTPSTSSTWPAALQLSVGLTNNLMEFGKINYYKFSYVKDDQTLTIYHSLDGKTWTSVASKDITSVLNGGTLYNDTTYDFCIGGNALSSNIAFPCDDDNHICIDKCKIISNGNIIFGWDSKKVLTGEAIIEEPTVYEVDCTSEIYNSLSTHDPRTIYNVVNQDDSVNKYLGEDLIGGTVDNLGEIVPKNYENETRVFEDRNIIYETKCTSTKYNSMSNHSENVLYSVLQPDNKVYKYLGDHQIGVDKTNVGQLDITNSTDKYIKTSMMIDQTKDFEFVICFTIPTGNRSYNIAGNPDMLGIGATVTNNSEDNTKAQGGFQFFYNTGGWDYRIGLNACPSAALIADGVTKNYYKLQRKGNYLYASYSIDGKNFILTTTTEIDTTGKTFSTEEPIYLGNVYPGYGEYSLNLLSFCLGECYLKQNGQIVFGNELKPVNFAEENINTNEYALPKSDITILKSIKSTGNSVIPTNIIPDYDWSVFLDAKFENPHLTTSGADIVFGILRSDEHFFIAMQQGSGWASYTAVSGYTAQSGDIYSIGDATSITRNLGTRQCCIMRRGTNKNCSFGDLSFEMTVKTTDSIPYKPITIMGTINESSETLKPYDRYDVTLYGIQIMDASDKLIHNFVPALSNISKRTGMYDLITETFYQSDKNFDDFEIEYISDESNNNYYDNIVAPVTFLKSVKSVGNSVVRTDIALDFDWEVHMSIMFSGTRKSTSPTYSFFGVGGSDPWFTAESADGTSVAFYIGFDNNSNPAITFNGMEPNTIIPIVARRNGDCICGNEYDSISDSVTGNPHSFGAAFFGVSTGSSTVLPFAYYDMTIYNVDIVDSTGSIIHKLVPAENNVGRGGLFDLVTNKFYPADNRYDDLIKDYGSNATRSPYNVYRILNPGEYKQNGMALSLSDFTDNADYYTYTVPIASSAGFTFEINLSFGDFENRSGLSSSDADDGHPVVTLFDSRNDNATSDRYGLRIICYSDNNYGVEMHKSTSWVFSRNLSTPLYIPRGLHTFTMTVENNGIAKAYVDGEFWISTPASGNIGILTRKFYIFTNANTSEGWTLYPQYRSVNRVMLYNRALTEQEILENRKADIVNFGE